MVNLDTDIFNIIPEINIICCRVEINRTYTFMFHGLCKTNGYQSLRVIIQAICCKTKCY